MIATFRSIKLSLNGASVAEYGNLRDLSDGILNSSFESKNELLFALERCLEFRLDTRIILVTIPPVKTITFGPEHIATDSVRNPFVADSCL